MHIKDTVEVATCCANYGCLSRLHFLLYERNLWVFLANLGNGGRSCVLYNCRNAKILTVMKQTVSIFAPDINVASKSSAIQLWLNRKNQFFSSVLEEDVSNRQVLLLGHASFVFSALICASFVSQVPALICLAWFMVALRLCVKGGLG